MNDDLARRKGGWKDWLVVLLLMMSLILSFIDRVGFSLLVDPIKADLGLNDAQMGLLQGVAFGLFFATMGVPAGWLADRWSRKGTIMLGIGLWSIATAASGFASSFFHLLIARIGVGAGEAGLAPASYSIVHDRFPQNQLGRAVGLFQVGSVIGAGSALLITGMVYHYFISSGAQLPLLGGLAPWQSTFLVIAAPGVLFVALTALIREPDIHKPQAAAEPPISMIGALRQRPLVYAGLFLGMSGVIMTSYALVSWLPAALGREFDWAPEVVGARYGAVVLICSPIGLLAGGWMADRLVRSAVPNAHFRTIAFAALLGLPFALLLAVPTSSLAVLLIVGGLHFAVSFPMGVVPAYLQISTPREARAQVSGLYVLVINVLGLGLGPTLVGALSTAVFNGTNGLRLSIALVVGPAMLLSALMLCFLAWKTWRKDQENAERRRP